ncbi:S-adenosyl-L-methionine-dependent methyltransferase [Ramaria rubella]|nr:S-adenosyl-L-methionine-dependent methyltransferase [Ramaria rubella]
MTSPSLLSSLLNLITTATHELQSELEGAGLPEPWIDNAALHPWDEETPSKKYWDARKTLISALGMMTAVVQNPREKILCDNPAYHHSAALHFIAETGIADILAAPDVDERVGLPVAEIARRTSTHPAKTERVLRFLCIHHTFQETSPAVFANNKVSTCLKKGHPTAEIPLMWGDVGLRSAAAFSATLRDPRTAHSTRIEDAPFGEVFSDRIPTPAPASQASQESTQLASDSAIRSELKPTMVPTTPSRVTMFEFLARPGNEVYHSAFSQTLVTISIMDGTQGYHDLDWGRWDTEGAVFVEAGASTGHLANAVLPVLKYAKFVNQDRPEVCLQGEKFFAENNPEALHSGRVTFQPNDFFTGQPVKGAIIYILANVLHDWPDKEASTILNHIADAMAPNSRLLVLEVVIVPSLSQSRSPPSAAKDLNGGDAPWPLPKDYGFVNCYPHHQSMVIMNLLNGLDRIFCNRTLDEYVALFERSGLELVETHRIRKLVSFMELKKKA